jgi:hypothetical protein
LELVLKELKLLCVVQIFVNIFVSIVELNLEGRILSLLCGIRTNCCTYSGSRSRFIFAPLLLVELEILAFSWAISSALTHMIFAHAWECVKGVVAIIIT